MSCQRHTSSSLAAVIVLSNNDVISFLTLRWLETPLETADLSRAELVCCGQLSALTVGVLSRPHSARSVGNC